MSDDDRLLRALGQLAREQEAQQPPADLLRPPAPAAQERVVGAVLAQLAGAAAPAAPAIAPPAAVPAARRRRWRWTLGLLVPLAAAAAGVVLWMRADPGAALPAYAMTVAGGVAEYRAAGAGDDGKPLALAAGAPLEVVLRPAIPARGTPGLRLFWVRGGQVRRWAVEPQRSPEGALRVRAPAEAPFGPGPGELVAIVARPDLLPDAIAVEALAAPADGWQILRRPVDWR
jgi:hypothetical protein